MFKHFVIASMFLMGLSVIAVAHSATTTTACVWDRWNNRWVCDSQTHYSQAEIQATQAQIDQYEKENPKGCNAPKDGLQLCWSYFKLNNMVEFYHQLDEQDILYSQRRHGLLYTYIDGKLKRIFIYDRDYIPKGENSYQFLDDGTVIAINYKDDKKHVLTVYNPKDPNIKNTTIISTDEALRRLKLPRSVLTLSVSTPEGLSSVRLPSGCSGDAKGKIRGRRSLLCDVSLLK